LDGKVVLVSGASSGLGLAIANHLAQTGHTVYAGARSYGSEDVTADKYDFGGRLKKTFIDVTDDTSIKNLVQDIILREGKVDALINCAAHLVFGSVEDTDIEEYKRVMETNLFGTLNVCKSVLPIMRKQGHGVIINVSSINGLMGIPFQSGYVTSKFAIEGLSECLSMEVKDFGIKVVILEPGDHRSGSENYRLHARKAGSPDSPYTDRFNSAVKRIGLDEAEGSDPQGVARLIARIISMKNPRLRYVIGRYDQSFAVFLKRITPGRLFERIIAGYYRK
jgi:NAD(P)-dependent dehydrogenase (short-subunit alcohol dehydrogenase family)